MSEKVVDKKLVREGISKATKEFSERISKYGFKRLKKWFWVRELESSIDFVHIHLDGKSYSSPINYSVSFRVHFGHTTDVSILTLNGPCSTNSEYRNKKYHHRFNAKTGSTYARCIQDLEKCVVEIGEPWYKTIRSGPQKNAIMAYFKKLFLLP